MLVHALFPCILCIRFLHTSYACPCIVSIQSVIVHTISPYILCLSFALIVILITVMVGWASKNKYFVCAYLNTLSIHSVLSHTLHACPYILSILMQRHPIILFTHNSSTLTQTPRRHCSFFLFFFLFMWNRYRFKTYTIGSSNSSNICLILWLIKYNSGAP